MVVGKGKGVTWILEKEEEKERCLYAEKCVRIKAGIRPCS